MNKKLIFLEQGGEGEEFLFFAGADNVWISADVVSVLRKKPKKEQDKVFRAIQLLARVKWEAGSRLEQI